MRLFVLFCVSALLISSCSSVKNLAVDKDIERRFNQSPIFSNQFTGFSLYDLENNKFVSGYNDTKKFTPASNTKILTMYVSLKTFTDSIPGMLVKANNNSVIVKPVGDATFLDSRFEKQPIHSYLSQFDSVKVLWPENEIGKFGSGWAWDDFSYDYQAARNWWPIYGNTVEIEKAEDSISIFPTFFSDFVEIVDGEYGQGLKIDRSPNFNFFQIKAADADTSSFEENIPFEVSKELLFKLLEDTIPSSFSYVEEGVFNFDTLYSQNIDHVLSLMMKVSDNLISEQLLIQAAWKNGYTSIKPFIKHAKLIWLEDLNDFVWVDGSGLSRYNLIAPVDQVRLLKKAHDEFGLDRIKNILAVGGESGTIKNWYAAEEPYIYAKTGTLSNNHNLSGFIKTRSGKWMIFSFMNNHFTEPLNNIKAEMQKLLEEIRDSY